MNMKNVLGIIIAFDTDNDLREITEHRTVAAVPFGGRYRIVDFMLSNMVNSGIYRVGMLMKDKYQSLIDHIGNAKDWDLSRKNGGVTMLPPYSYSKKASPLVTGEYRGKIDALAGAIDFLQKNRADYVVIADGDIVANIPIDDVVAQHDAAGNEITMVVTKKVKDSPFATYCEMNRRREIVDIRVGDSNDGKCKHEALGVYVMSRQYSVSYTHLRAHMDMLDKETRDEVFLRSRPIYTRICDESPAYYGDKANVCDSLVADGCHIEGKVVNSVLFRDVLVEKEAEVRDSIIMENGRILAGASLAHIVTDRGVTIREGRTMMGHENYPVVIAKSSVV